MYLVYVVELPTGKDGTTTRGTCAVVLKTINGPSEFYLLIPHRQRPEKAVRKLNNIEKDLRSKKQLTTLVQPLATPQPKDDDNVFAPRTTHQKKRKPKHTSF